MNQDIIDKIKRTEWFEWGTRRITTRLAESWVGDTKYFEKIVGIRFPDQLMLVENQIGTGYLEIRQFEKVKEFLLDHILAEGFEHFFEDKAVPVFEEHLRFARKNFGASLRSKSNKELAKILDEFLVRDDRFTNYLWLIFALDQFFPQLFEKELALVLEKSGEKDKYCEYLDILSTPFKLADSIHHGHVMLEVAAWFKASGVNKDLRREAKKLADEYGYFPIVNYDEQPFTSDYFESELKKILKNENNPENRLEKIREKYKNNLNRSEVLSAKFKENKRFITLADAYRRVAFYRDYRNEVRRKVSLLARSLYQEVASRLSITLADVVMQTRTEVMDALNGNAVALPNASQKPVSAFALLGDNFYSDFDAVVYQKIKAGLSKTGSVEEFKGIAASPGKVRGRVKVIISVLGDGQKFEAGDILVTSMTNLDFVPLMSKAAAIITNEGSRLCHAAIVSRELGIPCVVGTKIATKVLKGGDMVEVDAERGVVRKL